MIITWCGVRYAGFGGANDGGGAPGSGGDVIDSSDSSSSSLADLTKKLYLNFLKVD